MNNNPYSELQRSKLLTDQPANPLTLSSAPKTTDTKVINDYINKTVGISRTKLNVQAGIGVFIFGWLMKMNYDDLGESGFGKAFFWVMIGCLVAAKQIEPMLVVVALVIYLAAWVHTNVILTEKQRIVREEYFKQIP